MYKDRLRALLSPAERAVFQKLNTPHKIQDYLDALPQNFSYDRGSVLRSPRRILREGGAYCIEGAFVAACALAYHGHKPLLLDMQTRHDDEDHVVALFQKDGHWGALSKTNQPVLQWRDPIYKTVRELAMSYFNEYFLTDGRKTMKAYSAPFNLEKYPPETWVITEEPLEWLAVELDDSKHFPVASPAMLRQVRPVLPIEIETLTLVTWDPKTHKRKKK